MIQADRMLVVQSLAVALMYMGLALVLYVLGLFGYRVTLHPLSRYSGPPLGKFTDCYSLYHAALKRLHLAIWQNHLNYGKETCDSSFADITC